MEWADCGVVERVPGKGTRIEPDTIIQTTSLVRRLRKFTMRL
jgi:hypothetical protein